MADRSQMVRMVRTFMYRHPRREHGVASILAVLGSIALFMVVALGPVHLGSREAAAATGPLVVDGIVYSSTGNPVAGATVVVSVFNGLTLRTSQSNTTDGTGFYTMSIDPGFWDTGNTVVVVANDSSQVGQNQTVADEGSPFLTIDVHLGIVSIPEFGGPPAIVLAMLGTALPVVLLARRRKEERV